MPNKSSSSSTPDDANSREQWKRRGGPDIALDVWVTKEQEGWQEERLFCNLLLLHNPDAQSSVWATPPNSGLSTSLGR